MTYQVTWISAFIKPQVFAGLTWEEAQYARNQGRDQQYAVTVEEENS